MAASGYRDGSTGDDALRIHYIKGLERDTFAERLLPLFRERQAIRKFDVVESPEYFAEGRLILSAYPEIAHVVKLHTPSTLLREMNTCPLQASGWLRHHGWQATMALGALRRRTRPNPFKGAHSRSAPAAIEGVERNYVKQCDFVVSPSKALLKWATANWSIDPNNAMVVPNPFSPPSQLLDIGFSTNGRVVGFVGRLEYRKGICDLVEAIPLILRAEPNTQFRLIGRPLLHPGTLEPLDQYVRRRLRRYGYSIHISSGCLLDEIPLQYSGIDVCVFPSLWENFPNVCLEAMAAGRAIVASCAGGMAEMLERGGGILVAPNSPRQLAKAVVQFLKSPALRRSCGETVRRHVLAAYSCDAVLPAVEHAYERAIACNRRKRGYVRSVA
jgi:glycosyltransferase involved in cell wall biosynthesis